MKGSLKRLIDCEDWNFEFICIPEKVREFNEMFSLDFRFYVVERSREKQPTKLWGTYGALSKSLVHFVDFIN